MQHDNEWRRPDQRDEWAGKAASSFTHRRAGRKAGLRLQVSAGERSRSANARAAFARVGRLQITLNRPAGRLVIVLPPDLKRRTSAGRQRQRQRRWRWRQQRAAHIGRSYLVGAARCAPAGRRESLCACGHLATCAIAKCARARPIGLRPAGLNRLVVELAMALMQMQQETRALQNSMNQN